MKILGSLLKSVIIYLILCTNLLQHNAKVKFLISNLSIQKLTNNKNTVPQLLFFRLNYQLIQHRVLEQPT
jgi:hypothetical protein